MPTSNGVTQYGSPRQTFLSNTRRTNPYQQQQQQQFEFSTNSPNSGYQNANSSMSSSFFPVYSETPTNTNPNFGFDVRGYLNIYIFLVFNDILFFSIVHHLKWLVDLKCTEEYNKWKVDLVQLVFHLVLNLHTLDNFEK